MSTTKVRVYKIITKEMLEKAHAEPDNEKIFEKIQIEFLKNKQSAKLIPSFVTDTYPKNEQNNTSNTLQRSKTDNNFVTPHSNNSIKNSSRSLIDYVRNKKHKEEAEIHQLRDDIKKLKLRLSEIANDENRLNTGYSLRVSVQEKEVRLSKLLSSNPVKILKSNNNSSLPKKINKLSDQIELNTLSLRSKNNKVRIYDLAKELKQDTRRLLNELKREDTNIKVPSNSVSKELADKMRDKYSPKFSRKDSPPLPIKVVKSYKECPFCFAKIPSNSYETHATECPNRPNISKNTIFSEFDETDNKLIIEKLTWTLLPEGEWLFSEVTNHFKQLSSTKKWENKPFDENRLQKIEKSLKPNKCFIGNDEFDGYIVYCFDWTNKVVLECPIYGNAIYIIKQGKSTWQEIAKATKWEARTKYTDQVKVINHSETWLERLEQNLRYGF